MQTVLYEFQWKQVKWGMREGAGTLGSGCLKSNTTICCDLAELYNVSGPLL